MFEKLEKTRFLYWAAGDPPRGTWQFIEDTPLARQQAIVDGATAFTSMSFSNEPEKGKPEPIRYGDLIIDFDCKDNPSKAIADMLTFITNIVANYNIDPRMLRYWMSGNKGCHLAIPAKIFGGEDGDPYLPLIHRAMVDKLLDLNRMRDGSESVDFSLYCMARGKLLRTENVRRQNGRYKVPVTYDEIARGDYDALFRLTEAPRYLSPADRGLPPERNPGLEKLYDLCQDAATIAPRINRQSQAVETAEAECAFIQFCRDNAATLSEPMWYAMISSLCRLGRTGEALIHEYSQKHPGYLSSETDKKIAHARSASGPITCAKIKEMFDCGKQCKVKSPVQLYQVNNSQSACTPSCFSLEPDGVYFHENPEDLTVPGVRICSRLEIVAKTRDHNNRSWGHLVEVTDPDGHTHRLVIPSVDLRGNGDAALQRLMDAGLTPAADRRAKERLMAYLLNTQTERRGTLVRKQGWCGDVYILDNLRYGGREGEIYIPEFPLVQSAFNAQGSLEDWQERVGKLCLGHPIIEFVVSFAFVGPLLTPCGHDGIGIHLFGPSSCGKTTANRIAGSVCGGGGPNGFIRQWRATDNALEGTAALHNDNLLCLDEIGQAQSRVVSETSYMLPNGQGKGRANKEGNVRERYEWRLAFLSTGELTLSDKIALDGRDKAMAGQAVRVVDIEADGGTGHGIFTCLPNGMDGRTLSVQLNEATRQFYGTPLRAFLEKLATERDKAVDLVSASIREFLMAQCPPEASGQVKRVCDNFGLIASAGELAIQYGVLPWPKGTAQAAAVHCFQKWVKQRGGVGNMEVEYALERIKTFFQKYRDTRFRVIDTAGHVVTAYNPAGYAWDERGERYYLIEPSVFHEEIRKGVSQHMLLAELLKRGWLALNSRGRRMETKTVRGRGNVRGYIFIPRKWEDELN